MLVESMLGTYRKAFYILTTVQGCQVGLFRLNLRNLASFQVGWPKKNFFGLFWPHLKFVGVKKLV